MDEQERVDLVMEFHRRAGVELPNEQIHAIVQVIVENQVAMGDEVRTGATLERLMQEGLDRHDAIHAAGTVLINLMQSGLDGDDAAPDVNEIYAEELDKLSAAEWLKGLSCP